MPRQIEEELVHAIAAGRAFNKRHHAYDPVTRTVTLYGNAIAQISGEPGVGLWCSLAGYNTPRTRQTINAVARFVVGRSVLTVHNLQPFVDGRRVSVTEWWPVEAHSRPQDRAQAMGGAGMAQTAQSPPKRALLG